MDVTVGDIISGTFETTKKHFGALIGTWFVYFFMSIAAVTVIGIVLGVGALSASAVGNLENDFASGAIGVGVVVMMIVIYVAYIGLFIAMGASMTAIASPLKKVTFGEALGAGLRSVPTLIVVGILLFIVYLAGALVFTGVFRGLGSAGGPLTALLILLLVPALVYFGCRLSLILPLAAVEKVRNPVKVLTRSWKLTGGHVFKIFLATLALMVILGVIGGVCMIPAFGMENSNGVPNIGGILLVILGTMIFIVVATMLQSAFVATLHARLHGSSGIDLTEAFS